jgi:hypothetical protein
VEDERLKGRVDALIAGDSQAAEALLNEIPLDPSD